MNMKLTFFQTKLFVRVLPIFDVLFALIVVAPLVVLFWSTIWSLYDTFIFPNNTTLSCAISWTVGFFGQMVLMFYQDSIKQLLVFDKRNFINILILKLYALFLGHMSVCFWRAIWMFVDGTSPKHLSAVILNVVQNTITLMILKLFSNTLVPPFNVSTDQLDQYSMRTLLEKCVRIRSYK